MRVEKLWGGRFEEMPSQEIVDFLSGRDMKENPPVDQRLISYDLWGSRVHVLMLCRQGILTKQDGRRILRGLKAVETLYRKGKFRLIPSREDVHTNIESFLIQKIGMESGGKVHTGRSRNDQIVLDMRLYLRDQVLGFIEGLIGLIEVLLKRGEEHRLTVMPGYTHYQRAMITTFGHLLLSFAEALERDIQRFIHWFHLFNKNPLGAAAGYGTSFNLDRELTSQLFGFDGPTENVTDPITQRWEPEAEAAYAAAVMMDHLSTMAQTLILLSTGEFNMVRLHDRHCSGSSIMPQKRNPDSLEVIKAKTSFAHGMVTSFLSTGKALFMGYNRDTQWTKYWIVDLVEETQPALSVMADVLQFLEVNKVQMAKQAQSEFVGATSLMEWMVRSHGIPLRKAKIVMEKAVKYSEAEGAKEVSFKSLKKAVQEMKIPVPITQQSVEKMQQPYEILARTRSVGTPLEKRVREHLASLRGRIKEDKHWCTRQRKSIEKGKSLAFRMESAVGG
ncbi:MAG: argininosuccinate lyase [Deltaproteobacteria bacterium RBG_16_48_10]|nr:MAG: argininosuccinate lyase [Deltaproteobacteria bacterium RBG_16_48_10]